MRRLALALCTVAALQTAPAAAQDAIDDVRATVAARLALMSDVARYKWNHALPVVDAGREAALLASATRDAVAHGLPEPWARQALTGQIAASRALQAQLTARWRAAHEPAFAAVPELATVQRPAIDAATARLIEALAVGRCALAGSDASRRLAAPPAELGDAVDAWRIATAALLPVPADGCRPAP